MHLVAGASRRKAAIRAGDDILSTGHAGKALDPVRDKLWVLDLIDAVRHHTRDEDLAGRQLHLLPHAPFVFMARIGGFDRIGLRANLEHQVHVMLELEIVYPWGDVDAVTGVETNAVLGNALQ